jgi:hypothetical protein
MNLFILINENYTKITIFLMKNIIFFNEKYFFNKNYYIF